MYYILSFFVVAYLLWLSSMRKQSIFEFDIILSCYYLNQNVFELLTDLIEGIFCPNFLLYDENSPHVKGLELEETILYDVSYLIGVGTHAPHETNAGGRYDTRWTVKVVDPPGDSHRQDCLRTETNYHQILVACRTPHPQLFFRRNSMHTNALPTFKFDISWLIFNISCKAIILMLTAFLNCSSNLTVAAELLYVYFIFQNVHESTMNQLLLSTYMRCDNTARCFERSCGDRSIDHHCVLSTTDVLNLETRNQNLYKNK
ncbi:hypothetical protein AGLY_007571, partial [Aphis glycines]